LRQTKLGHDTGPGPGPDTRFEPVSEEKAVSLPKSVTLVVFGLITLGPAQKLEEGLLFYPFRRVRD
jgi:hypothetical protein